MPIFNTNTPLAPLTTFEIGGSADFFIEVATEDTLINAIEFSLEKNVPFYLLSGGSNILFPDEGILLWNFGGDHGLQ